MLKSKHWTVKCFGVFFSFHSSRHSVADLKIGQALWIMFVAETPTTNKNQENESVLNFAFWAESDLCGILERGGKETDSTWSIAQRAVLNLSIRHVRYCTAEKNRYRSYHCAHLCSVLFLLSFFTVSFPSVWTYFKRGKRITGP